MLYIASRHVQISKKYIACKEVRIMSPVKRGPNINFLELNHFIIQGDTQKEGGN